MTGLNIKSFSYIQDTPLFLFAAVNKTSSDILKLSSFVQSISGLFCQTEVPMKTGFGWADLFLPVLIGLINFDSHRNLLMYLVM